MHFDLITLFPECLDLLSFGVIARARKLDLMRVTTWNPRDYTTNTHRQVDDRPFGGGPGMVLQAEPLYATLMAIQKQGAAKAPVICMSPQGMPLTQQIVAELHTLPSITILSGRYEGIDQRFLDEYVDAEYSLGDFIVSGGELPALMLIDAITRLIPGVLGDERSAVEDSFVAGRLDHPHYTRPEIWQSHQVPEVLLSGDHQAIAKFRQGFALYLTMQRRPNLFEKKPLLAEEEDLLNAFQDGYYARLCLNRERFS